MPAIACYSDIFSTGNLYPQSDYRQVFQIFPPDVWATEVLADYAIARPRLLQVRLHRRQHQHRQPGQGPGGQGLGRPRGEPGRRRAVQRGRHGHDRADAAGQGDGLPRAVPVGAGRRHRARPAEHRGPRRRLHRPRHGQGRRVAPAGPGVPGRRGRAHVRRAGRPRGATPAPSPPGTWAASATSRSSRAPSTCSSSGGAPRPPAARTTLATRCSCSPRPWTPRRTPTQPRSSPRWRRPSINFSSATPHAFAPDRHISLTKEDIVGVCLERGKAVDTRPVLRAGQGVRRVLPARLHRPTQFVRLNMESNLKKYPALEGIFLEQGYGTQCTKVKDEGAAVRVPADQRLQDPLGKETRRCSWSSQSVISGTAPGQRLRGARPRVLDHLHDHPDHQLRPGPAADGRRVHLLRRLWWGSASLAGRAGGAVFALDADRAFRQPSRSRPLGQFDPNTNIGWILTTLSGRPDPAGRRAANRGRHREPDASPKVVSRSAARQRSRASTSRST